jgi:hypothetical protein
VRRKKLVRFTSTINIPRYKVKAGVGEGQGKGADILGRRRKEIGTKGCEFNFL